MPWNCLYFLSMDISMTDNNYLLFCQVIWCFCYFILNNYVKYYIINIIEIRKNKINVCKLVTTNNYTGCIEKKMMIQADLLKQSFAKINNINKIFFEMRLEIDTTIKSLPTLIIYI